MTNTQRTLSALTNEGESHSLTLATDEAGQFTATLHSTYDTCPAWDATQSFRLQGVGATADAALRDLEDLCSDPRHLAALADLDL